MQMMVCNRSWLAGMSEGGVLQAPDFMAILAASGCDMLSEAKASSATGFGVDCWNHLIAQE